MSQPSIPNITPDISITRDESVNLILSSIAMQELGLSHIINAEAEKIKYVIGTLSKGGLNPPPSLEEVTRINRTVRDVLKEVFRTEMVLHSKMDSVKEFVALGGGHGAPHPPAPHPVDPPADPSVFFPQPISIVQSPQQKMDVAFQPVMNVGHSITADPAPRRITRKKRKPLQHKKKPVCKPRRKCCIPKGKGKVCRVVNSDKKVIKKTFTMVTHKQQSVCCKLKRGQPVKQKASGHKRQRIAV